MHSLLFFDSIRVGSVIVGEIPIALWKGLQWYQLLWIEWLQFRVEWRSPFCGFWLPSYLLRLCRQNNCKTDMQPAPPLLLHCLQNRALHCHIVQSAEKRRPLLRLCSSLKSCLSCQTQPGSSNNDPGWTKYIGRHKRTGWPTKYRSTDHLLSQHNQQVPGNSWSGPVYTQNPGNSIRLPINGQHIKV